MNVKEIEALFDLLEEHILKVEHLNEIVDFINNKIQEDNQ